MPARHSGGSDGKIQHPTARSLLDSTVIAIQTARIWPWGVRTMELRRLCRQLCGGALALMTAIGPASPSHAQDSNSGVSIGPSQSVAQGKPVPTPSVEHLFGDWGGVRTNLGNLGIDLIADVTSEFAGNVSGGVKQGATFANQVGFEADIDWQKLAGLPGFATHAVIVNRSGSSDSQLFGDTLEPVQEIYGAGGNTALHLVYVYGEQSLAGGRIDLAAGRLPLANDFAASPLYCNFMNNSLCGNPKALPGGDVGFSSYPDAAWAARARLRPTPRTYVQFGVYEVNQGIYSNRNFRSGFKFDASQDAGVMLPIEAAWEPRFGTADLIGHYKLGFAYDTSRQVNFFAPTVGAPPALAAQQSERRTGNTQVWALADQMLVRNGPGPVDGLVALAGFIHNDPNNSAYAEEYFAGTLLGNFWRVRPRDIVGLLLSYNTVSGRLGRGQGLEQAFGLPLSGNATGIQTHEMAIEANYDIHVTRGVNFAPDFQYIIRPNAQANIKNATVFGFKTHVTF